MPIVSIGVNHKSASIALRERLVFSAETLTENLEHLLAVDGISEAVILSTCNRTEIYAIGANPEILLPWLALEKGVSCEILQQHCYFYSDEQAIGHLMTVACGLDSMIVGEPQIFGQLKMAFAKANNLGAVGMELGRLFQRVFFVAKKVRASTSIGVCPVSLASTTIAFARKTFPELHRQKILIIGAGEAASFIAKRFAASGVQTMIVANRTRSNANRLAADVAGIAISLAEVSRYLAVVDIVITATASPVAVLDFRSMKEFLTARHSPLLMLDLGVPRNIDPEFSTLSSVNLHCIDDLRAIIQENIHGREHAAIKAQQMIQQETLELMRWLRSLGAVSMINAYRQHVERIRTDVLEDAVQSLNRGVPAVEALTQLALALSNRLMHSPSVQLRKAGYDGRFDILEVAQEILGID